jgi:hypothetical protein
MSEVLQKFILKNTKGLQYIVNEKLAKRKGKMGSFFNWMQIGPRHMGEHVIPRWFRVWNSYMLDYGFRMNWVRPHLTKFFTREREIFIIGYAMVFIVWAWWTRKNRIRPLYRYSDYHLYHYDNPTRLSHKYKTYIPFNTMNFRQSAHYLEINKIFHAEMMKKVNFCV